ncbi:CBS domain-containing protein [Candidatus Woesearchaeota archaeon]|nr:CBS domain-containing protein [Candidatus Woesearchaeota archaeon]
MEPLTVKDWMSKNVIGVVQDAPVSDAAKLMTSHRIGALVVFNRKDESFFFKRRTCGIITDTDIVRKVVGKGQSPDNLTVKDVMTTGLITGSPDDTIQSIGQRMIDANIKRILIVSGDKTLAIVSLTDLIDWLGQERSRMREMISEEVATILKNRYASGEQLTAPNDYQNAANWMTTSVVSIRATASAYDAAQLIAERYIGAVPVVSETGVDGIVTITDIVRRLVAQGLDPQNTSVAQVMSTPAICVGAEASLPDVLETLGRNRIKHVPVLDQAGHMVGIISHKNAIQVILRTGMVHYLGKLSKMAPDLAVSQDDIR